MCITLFCVYEKKKHILANNVIKMDIGITKQSRYLNI